MSLNFRILLLCYPYVIVYAVFTRIMLWQRSLQRSFVTLILCFYVYSCSDDVMLTVSIMLIWGNIVILLTYFHTDAYFQRICYFVKFQQSYDILTLLQARKHNIHPFNRDNTIWIYLSNTSPVSSLFINPTNEPISSPLLQEHRKRNEEVSCKNNYSSKMFYASFVLTLLFI